MSWKQIAQHSLADMLLVEHKSLSELDDVHEVINWSRIEKLLCNLYSSKVGSPSYPPLMMFKILVLQAWYNLSDEALEKQIARDLMFRKFIDLSLSETVPDHSTIWRFRNLLQSENLLEPLLEEINECLTHKGIIITQGSISIIDATVIEANRSRPRKGKSGKNTQDSDAAYNVKTASNGKRKTTYGYKMHINTDEDGFIKKVAYTAGNVHDSKEFDKLLDNQRRSPVYADSAYANKENDKKLGKANNKVLHRAYRSNPLTEEQKYQNKRYSGTRYIVERTFGLLKQHHGLGKSRHLGLERNKVRAQLIAISHNLKTGMNIFKGMKLLEKSYA